MMPTSQGTSNIRCPFYRMHKKKSIGCEGMTDDCKLLILYEAEEERKKQQRIFCAQRFEKCEIYEMIMKAKYTEE